MKLVKNKTLWFVLISICFAFMYALFISIQIIRKKNLLSKFKNILLKKSTFEALALVLCVGMLLFKVISKSCYTAESDNYVKYLGNDKDGYLSETLADPILKASEIIGDENQQRYLDIFKNGNYKYAITINTQLTPNEYLTQNANCFFIESFAQNIFLHMIIING
jgi:hypothetical protein